VRRFNPRTTIIAGNRYMERRAPSKRTGSDAPTMPALDLEPSESGALTGDRATAPQNAADDQCAALFRDSSYSGAARDQLTIAAAER
jgi:hypothetical protein